jgi:hypothetical protein
MTTLSTVPIGAPNVMQRVPVTAHNRDAELFGEVDFDLHAEFDWVDEIRPELAYNIARFGDAEARLALLHHPSCTVDAVCEMANCSDPEVVAVARADAKYTGSRGRRRTRWLRPKRGRHANTFRNFEYVQPTTVGVLLPVPQRPDTTPIDRLMTITTCNPPFHAGERLIAYTVFHDFAPTQQVPSEIAAAVAANGG